MIIRKATKKDFKAMAELMKNEFAKPPYNEKWTMKDAINTFKDYFKTGWGYVVPFENKPVGFIVVRTGYYNMGMEATIAELVVASEFHLRGIGKALIKKVESDCKKRKIKRVLVSTSKKAPAFTFYKHLRYVPSENTVFLGKVLK